MNIFGKYSTAKTLADEINLIIERPSFMYCGALCGVIGTIDCTTVHELHVRFTKVLGHKTSLYQYGNANISNEKIAICPGGSNVSFVLNEMLNENIKTLITGITIINEYSKEVHELEKANKINVIGGTHYSTEKFAMIKMCNYIKNLGIPSEFIEDKPSLFDL